MCGVPRTQNTHAHPTHTQGQLCCSSRLFSWALFLPGGLLPWWPPPLLLWPQGHHTHTHIHTPQQQRGCVCVCPVTNGGRPRHINVDTHRVRERTHPSSQVTLCHHHHTHVHPIEGIGVARLPDEIAQPRHSPPGCCQRHEEEEGSPSVFQFFSFSVFVERWHHHHSTCTPHHPPLLFNL